jgi:hypothetical protein
VFPTFSLTFLILSALFIGLVVGVAMGLVACLVLRLKIRLRDVITDSIFGALGFSVAWEMVLLVPWRNTITYRVGDTVVTSTMNHFQHPDLLAYITACLLPALHEIHRFRKSATKVSE